MSLRNLSEIDLIIRMPGVDASAALVIYDGGEIADPQAREEALQKKLAAYLSFLASGQFLEVYPELSDCVVHVEIVCRQQPTDGMKQIASIRDTTHPDLVVPSK